LDKAIKWNHQVLNKESLAVVKLEPVRVSPEGLVYAAFRIAPSQSSKLDLRLPPDHPALHSTRLDTATQQTVSNLLSALLSLSITTSDASPAVLAIFMLNNGRLRLVVEEALEGVSCGDRRLLRAWVWRGELARAGLFEMEPAVKEVSRLEKSVGKVTIASAVLASIELFKGRIILLFLCTWIVIWNMLG
jgi:hypothetical protein